MFFCWQDAQEKTPPASLVIQCYAKATSVGRRFSEGGTHEETLRPQDLGKGVGESMDDWRRG